MVLALRRLDIFWLALGSVSFFLMLGVLKVKDVPLLKWELLTFLMIPLFLGMSGISRTLEGYLFGVDLAFVLITPTIGFMMMFVLHHHTKLHMNLPFAVFFVVIFSLASGALIGIGEYLSDQYLGTSLLKNIVIDITFM